MIEVLNYLDERQEEFEQHLATIKMLDRHMGSRVDDEDALVKVHRINILKSGLLIHLYNIVEAVMTEVLDIVGKAVVTEKPSLWTEAVLTEWVRAEIWGAEERIGESAVKRLAEVSGALASGNSLDAFKVKGVPGSWDVDAIRKVAGRLGCELSFSSKIKRAAYAADYNDGANSLGYLAQRRNEIAHGVRTFEKGASELKLDELEELANRVLPYLRAVCESYQVFLEEKQYLTEGQVGA